MSGCQRLPGDGLDSGPEAAGTEVFVVQVAAGQMELVTASCGVILVLGDYPCSLAIRVVFYLSLPGKATCLEAPHSVFLIQADT